MDQKAIIVLQRHSNFHSYTPEYYAGYLDISTPLNRSSLQLPCLELIHNLLHRDPLYPLVPIDPLNQPLMQQYHLRLPTNLRMDTNREHKAAVLGALAVKVLELLFPQALDDRCVDEAVRARLRQRQLEWRPVVEVPVGGDLDDGAGVQSRHGRHPMRGGLGDVCFGVGGQERVGDVVGLGIVVHEGVIVFLGEM